MPSQWERNQSVAAETDLAPSFWFLTMAWICATRAGSSSEIMKPIWVSRACHGMPRLPA